MRFLRIFVSVLTVIVLGANAYFYFRSKLNQNPPILVCKEEEIDVPIKVTDKELLAYVSANDPQDGDLTDKIVLEKKNYFVSSGVSKIVYSVCDKDGHVTSLERPIRYTDYVPPRFLLSSDLIFLSGKNYNLTEYVKATDVLDGDLTSRVKIISNDFSTVPGSYDITLKVTNSMGDSQSISLTAIVTDQDYSGIKIGLSQYLIYLPIDSTVNFQDYISGVYNRSGEKYKASDVTVDDSAVDLQKVGTYEVTYLIRSGNDVVSMTRLAVVVEGGGQS